MALDQATKQRLEKELLPFLHVEARPDLRSIATRYLLEMTGSKEGREFIAEGDKFLPAIMALTSDTQGDAAKDAYLALINLSADDPISYKLMHVKDRETFISELLQIILKPDFAFADEACSIVANVTRLPGCARKVAEQILAENSKVSMEKIVNALCQVNFNNKKAHLHYLGPILSNLTQVPAVRKTVMDKDKCIIQKLLPFTEYAQSYIRRGGIIAALKNCCFEYDYHQWLLSENDILSRLLLPLAGSEELDEEEMEKLPLDLQYLPPDKEREVDPDIRIILIEAITQLCSTKKGRLFVKENNAYVILRELHKWEKDPKAKFACQKLCELLISEEPEEGMEDLHKVEVPTHLAEEFEKLDVAVLKDIEEEIQDGEKLQKPTDS